MSMEKNLAQVLIARKKTLSVAESCSGGLLCHRLTNVPGSSNFLKCGLVVYSNAAKIKLLKIPATALNTYGAVSEPVARQMAGNVQKLLKTDFGLATTGIAGPSGGSPSKPVGLTFIAVSSKKKIVCRKFLFKGNRWSVKSQATTQSLKMLLKCVNQMVA